MILIPSSLQSLDSQPEQIALRPKEFFLTYDIEVLTETQVRGFCGSFLLEKGNITVERLSALGGPIGLGYWPWE